MARAFGGKRFACFPQLCRRRIRARSPEVNVPTEVNAREAAKEREEPAKHVGESRKLEVPPGESAHVSPDTREALRPNTDSESREFPNSRQTGIKASQKEAEMRAGDPRVRWPHFRNSRSGFEES